MSKKRRFLFMTIGIAAGIILSACAGAAAGRFDTGSGVLTGGPMIQLWQAPSLENSTVSVEPVQGSYVLGHSMSLSRSTTELLNQLEMIPGHYCRRGDDG
jgi:hypothetical protein